MIPVNNHLIFSNDHLHQKSHRNVCNPSLQCCSFVVFIVEICARLDRFRLVLQSVLTSALCIDCRCCNFCGGAGCFLPVLWWQFWITSKSKSSNNCFGFAAAEGERSGAAVFVVRHSSLPLSRRHYGRCGWMLLPAWQSWDISLVPPPNDKGGFKDFLVLPYLCSFVKFLENGSSVLALPPPPPPHTIITIQAGVHRTAAADVCNCHPLSDAF